MNEIKSRGLLFFGATTIIAIAIAVNVSDKSDALKNETSASVDSPQQELVVVSAVHSESLGTDSVNATIAEARLFELAESRSYEAVEAYVIERYNSDKHALFEALIAGIPDFNYEAAASAITYKMVQEDNWEAQQYFLEMASLSPDLGSYLLPSVISSMTESDYHTVKAWVLEQQDGYGLAQSAHQIGLWAVGGGYSQAATELLNELKLENPTHVAFYKGYVEGLTHWDFEATGDLLKEMEGGPYMDLTIIEYLKFSQHLDAEISMQWAESIGDPSIRRGAVLDMASEWQLADPAGYNQWLSRSDLDADLKAELIHQFDLVVSN